MSQLNRADLKALLEEKVLTGGRRTRAEGLRVLIEAIVDSVSNIEDDGNANNGFIKLDSSGLIEDISTIAAASPSGLFLKDDGSWRKIFDFGEETFNGTGVQTKFTVSHSLGATPTIAIVTPASEDSASLFYVNSYTPTTFDIEFLVPPIAGTNNVVINFLVK